MRPSACCSNVLKTNCDSPVRQLVATKTDLQRHLEKERAYARTLQSKDADSTKQMNARTQYYNRQNEVRVVHNSIRHRLGNAFGHKIQFDMAYSINRAVAELHPGQQHLLLRPDMAMIFACR